MRSISILMIPVLSMNNFIGLYVCRIRIDVDTQLDFSS